MSTIDSASVTRRVWYWAPLVARFFWLQAIAQALAIVAGLVIVRGLGVDAFAIYTVAIAVQTTAAILADSGVTQSLMARGGAVADDARRLTEVINTAVHLRRRLEAATVALAAPILLYLLHANGTGWLAAALGAGAVAIAVHASIDQSVFSSVLMLQLRPLDAQRAAVASGAARLALVGGVLVVSAHWLPILWAGTIAAIVQGWLMRRGARVQLADHDGVSAEDRAAMLVAFRNQLLNGIYFALQPQITVWAITVFGSVQKIAEVGALGRLAVVFTVLSTAFSSLALPRFARRKGAATVRRYYAGLLGLVVLVVAFAVGASAAFPRVILWILGPNYLHLESELVWMVAAGGLAVVASAVYLLNTARGWVRGVWVAVPAAIAAQVLVGWLVDLGTIRGAILLQMGSTIAALLVSILIGVRGLRQASDSPVSDPRGSTRDSA